MRRPPASVAHVARTHWIVGGVILLSAAFLAWLLRRVPMVEFGPRTHVISFSLAAAYLLAGTLVWFGVPWLGPLLSRVCALIYLARPNFGSLIWDLMNEPEFKAHFQRQRMDS